MSNHNPKRLIITAIAAVAVAGAALLPGIASADGGSKPRPHGPAANGIWVPQGSPVISGGADHIAPTRVVDAADYVI
jgi:hypothetical protein